MVGLNTYGLKGAANPVPWRHTLSAASLVPVSVVYGNDPGNMAFQFALADWQGVGAPRREDLAALHRARQGKSAATVVVAAIGPDRVWLTGPAGDAAPIELDRDQALRVMQEVLREPDRLAARERFGSLQRAVTSASQVGIVNEGLFASHFLETSVSQRGDWRRARDQAKVLLPLRDEQLIRALGFDAQRTASHAMLLTSTKVPRAVAVLLRSDEQFDAQSQRFGVSPVAWGLSVAARHEVPWLIVMRGSRLRIHPAKPGVGVGQRGQADTWFEIDLATVDADQSAFLSLVFSAAALAPEGSTQQLLDGSSQYAVALGQRLRARVYDEVIPRLSEAVAGRVAIEREDKLDQADLDYAYRLSLKILFRLLFQAYAEDSGLLPYGRNARYDHNALNTLARDLADDPDRPFDSESTALWDDLCQVWRVIDTGNKAWGVPAYNGGLFGTDPVLHPDGAAIDSLGLPDKIMGPVLRALLIDEIDGGGAGPVDFRSLSVREFGTIYEGLLESSLSIATQDLTHAVVRAKGKISEVYAPAKAGDQVFVRAGGVYFHSKSGERKATGTYFTPHIVVEHLLERSLRPALADHLARIKVFLDDGDEAGAGEAFFDFRVADLAMGSAHFLTAAIDHIEAAMRDFLTDNPIPAISNELRTLDAAAREALGEEVGVDDVDPAQLLRRQIARRCIYGLDINYMAVELARLAIWIATFVPGLPMSTLDHNLACANSLTGVATIGEALSVLDPRDDANHGSLFSEAITRELTAAADQLAIVANSAEATKADARRNTQALIDVRARTTLAQSLFDAVVAVRLGLIPLEDLTSAEAIDDAMTRPDVGEAVRATNPGHFPLLFPEVFTRDKPGFDVILGNPPWEKLKVEQHSWWTVRFPGLRSLSQKEKNEAIAAYEAQYSEMALQFNLDTEKAKAAAALMASGPFPGIGAGDIDLMAAFAWRFLHCLREGGAIGAVLPRTAFAGSACSQWRGKLMSRGDVTDLTMLVNSRQWVFPDIHPQYTVAALAFRLRLGGSHTVSLQGPYASREAFTRGTADPDSLAVFSSEEVMSWTDSAALPLLPTEDSLSVFAQMRTHPNMSDETGPWRFRPHRELDTTKEKHLYDFDLDNPAPSHSLPVLTGRSFHLWNPDYGPPYAFADPADVTNLLMDRRRRQIRLSSSPFYGLSPEWASDESTLPLRQPRIAFRDVARATDSRTVICCLLPPEVSPVHKAPYLIRLRGEASDEAYVLGILSSHVFDWAARRFVETTMSFTILNGLPVPRIDNESVLSRRVVQVAGRLAAVDGRYSDWASEVGVPVESVTSSEEQADLIAELDALVGLLYGLDRAQFSHIFETFHVGWDYGPLLEASLVHFDRWSKEVTEDV